MGRLTFLRPESIGSGRYRHSPMSSLFPEGVWTNITPAGVVLSPHSFTSTFGIPWIEVSRSNPSTVYCCVDNIGLYKSTNAGKDFSIVGQVAGTPNFGTTTTYLDSPICCLVDPANENHVIAAQGVRGTTLGFWTSSDGGVNWTQPAGFTTAATTTGNQRDVTLIAADPTDFNHLIMSSHTPWATLGYTNAGVLESTDCGLNWTARAPDAAWPNGTMGLGFAYDPASSQGNSSTWIALLDGYGITRTTNNGTSWTQVSTAGPPHGGGTLYYAADGKLYTGGAPYPLRSNDNGVTWTALSSLPSHYYYTVQGAAGTLYTQLAYTGDNAFGGGDQPYKTSLESDGLTWVTQAGAAGAQTFTDGPFRMYWVASTRRLYSANWASGLWVLQL